MSQNVCVISKLSLMVGKECTAIFSQNIQSLFHVDEEWNVDSEVILIFNEGVANIFERIFNLTKFLIQNSTHTITPKSHTT